MANKSFVVQYLIKARDSYSAAAEKTRAATVRMAEAVTRAKKASADMSQQSATLRSRLGGVVAAFRRTPATIERTRVAIDKLKASVREAGGGVTGLASSLAGFFSLREAGAVALQFQDAIADLSSITGAAGKDLSFLSDEALRLSKASATAQDQVATAFKIVASAKSELLEDPKGLSRVTEQVLLLANAAGIDLTTAANVATQALNQYSAGAEEAARFVNVLAAGSKIGASEVAETGVAIVKSGAVAKQVGVSFEQLNAAVQVLAKGGIKAEVAGTGLKTALLRLERTGVRQLMPSVVGLTEAFANLGKMNLNTLKMQKMFGDEAIVTGTVLSNNSALLGEWTNALTGTKIAEEQASIRLATLSKRGHKFWLVVREGIIKAFVKLEPVLSAVISGLTKASEASRGWLPVIVLLAAGVAALAAVVGAVATALPMLTIGATALGAAFAIATGPVGLLVAALAGAAYLIVSNWQRVKNYVTGVLTGLSDAAGPAVGNIIGHFQRAAAIIMQAFGPVIEFLKVGFQSAAGVVAELFGKNSDVVKALTDFSNIGQLIGNIIGGALDVVLRGLAGIGTLIGQVIGAVTTMDFSQFDLEAVKAEFLGAKAEPLLTQTRVDVGLNIGLERGLAQSEPAQVVSNGARRIDVGALAQ